MKDLQYLIFDSKWKEIRSQLHVTMPSLQLVYNILSILTYSVVAWSRDVMSIYWRQAAARCSTDDGQQCYFTESIQFFIVILRLRIVVFTKSKRIACFGNLYRCPSARRARTILAIFLDNKFKFLQSVVQNIKPVMVAKRQLLITFLSLDSNDVIGTSRVVRGASALRCLRVGFGMVVWRSG